MARIRRQDGQRTFSAEDLGQGRLVICLHGFPDSWHSFLGQAEAFQAAGYRVLLPTLRGYEATSVGHDNDFRMLSMADDVVAWMDELGEQRAHLVGHDWGSPLAYIAALKYPHRFASLSVLAVPPLAGLQRGIAAWPWQVRKSWYMAFFQLGAFADRRVAKNDFRFIEKLWSAWSPGWRPGPNALPRVKAQFAEQGTLHAALEYYRQAAQWGHEDNRALRRLLRKPMTVPTLALAGRNDGCMDWRIFAPALKSAPMRAEAQLHFVEGAGHFMHQEKMDEVSQRLLDWFARFPIADEVI